jgi:hypothetical protein
MKTEVVIQLGHARICNACKHQGEDLSHPFPCARHRWVGTKHESPSVTARSCNAIELVDEVKWLADPVS